MEGRGVNGWSCGSISNKCNWLPLEWVFFFFPPPLGATGPIAPQLWAATFREWEVCLVGTENEVGTHTQAVLSHHGSFIHILTVAHVHSQLELVKIGLGQLGWDVCVHKMAPEFWAMVTHRPEVSVFSRQSFSINRYLCWLRVWGHLNKLLSNRLFRNTRSWFAVQALKKRTLFFKCLHILLRKNRDRVDAQKYKTLPLRGVEFGPCSSVNSGFLLPWVQLFPIWVKCLLLWLYVLQFEHTSNFNPN